MNNQCVIDQRLDSLSLRPFKKPLTRKTKEAPFPEKSSPRTPKNNNELGQLWIEYGSCLFLTRKGYTYTKKSGSSILPSSLLPVQVNSKAISVAVTWFAIGPFFSASNNVNKERKKADGKRKSRGASKWGVGFDVSALMCEILMSVVLLLEVAKIIIIYINRAKTSLGTYLSNCTIFKSKH